MSSHSQNLLTFHERDIVQSYAVQLKGMSSSIRTSFFFYVTSLWSIKYPPLLTWPLAFLAIPVHFKECHTQRQVSKLLRDTKIELLIMVRMKGMVTTVTNLSKTLPDTLQKLLVKNKVCQWALEPLYNYVPLPLSAGIGGTVKTKAGFPYIYDFHISHPSSVMRKIRIPAKVMMPFPYVRHPSYNSVLIASRCVFCGRVWPDGCRSNWVLYLFHMPHVKKDPSAGEIVYMESDLTYDKCRMSDNGWRMTYIWKASLKLRVH